jgi:prepilin-type N-terminal cleavage/methylation domain-containing protein
MLGAAVSIKNGFTLVEALVSVTILALLATLAIPSFQDSLTRLKVRKTADLIAEVISMSQSEALRRNTRIYVAVITGNLCVGTALGLCDLRSQSISSGVNIAAPSLVLSPFYGVPSPAPAVFTVSYSGVTQPVSVNRMGLITIGALQ